jgi:hypothetical protein
MQEKSSEQKLATTEQEEKLATTEEELARA